jgi:hypothetical protein
MYRDRSAGLETVVSQIAFINGHHAALDAKDISFDVSTRQLYLTGSAMLTLFLSHNPSAGSSTISLRTRTPGNLSILLGNYKAYSTLRVTVPQEKLIHDMKATSNFEGH